MRRNWWIERQEEQDGTLKFHSALGDLDAVRTSLDENGNGLTAVNEAFMCACRFEHLAVASVLLERSMALDAELGKNVDGSVGRQASRPLRRNSSSSPLARDSMRPLHTDGITTAPASSSNSAHATRVKTCSLCAWKLSP